MKKFIKNYSKLVTEFGIDIIRMYFKDIHEYKALCLRASVTSCEPHHTQYDFVAIRNWINETKEYTEKNQIIHVSDTWNRGEINCPYEYDFNLTKYQTLKTIIK